MHLSANASAQVACGRMDSRTPAPSVPDLIAIAYDGPDPRASPGGSDRVGTPTAAIPATAWPGAALPWRVGSWRPSWTPDDHADAVRKVLAAIAEGDVYQVNVVGHASAPYAGDPRPALTRVAGLPGARYPIVLSGSGWALGCASPETLVEVSGGRIITRPIKGTRPATANGRAALLASEKERAEHVMIVDLSRNDVSRVAVTGSVRVDELYAIREWSGLWQAESVVSGELAAGTGLASVLRALCPGGSVTGAPKLAALAEIAAIEPVGRGPSMGALGWLTHDRLDLGLTIRTVAADAGSCTSGQVVASPGAAIRRTRSPRPPPRPARSAALRGLDPAAAS